MSSLPALLKHVASRLERVREKYSGRPDSAETIDLDDDDARELGHAVALLRLVDLPPPCGAAPSSSAERCRSQRILVLNMRGASTLMRLAPDRLL